MVVKTVKRQEITERYSLYCGDSVEVLPGIPDESVGHCIHSPPFAELYQYTDEDADLANSGSYDEFFKHYRYITDELFRVMQSGRVVAVHCMDLPTFKRNGDEIGLSDFPGDIVTLFKQSGFTFHSRHMVWKDPLIAAVRTHAIGLAHQQIVKDSSVCRMGIADQILAFRKPGENKVPIRNERGLTEYHGSREVPKNLDKFIGYEGEQKLNKRSHWIWQQYASPFWFDIRQTKVLPYRAARDGDDQKHVAPLQCDIVERCVALWSAKSDVVLTPFMGIGTEVVVAVRNGRKGVGIELKDRYYRQAVRNVRAATQESKGFSG